MKGGGEKGGGKEKKAHVPSETDGLLRGDFPRASRSDDA